MSKERAFSKGFEKIFLIFICMWIVGMVLASIFCSELGVVGSYVDFVPSVNSYAEAVKNDCVAYGVWSYAWVSFPIFLSWLFISGRKEAGWDATKSEKLALLMVFAFSIWACVFGLYDTYPGTSNGKLALFFREEVMGTLIGTGLLWTAFWISIFSWFLIIKYKLGKY